MGTATRQQEVLEELRRQIRRMERRPARREGVLACGRPEVEALLPGGGFPRGSLSSLCGGPASGKTGVALSALREAQAGGGLAAFVDGRGELYPPAALALGVDLARLLIVRPEPARGARTRCCPASGPPRSCSRAAPSPPSPSTSPCAGCPRRAPSRCSAGCGRRPRRAGRRRSCSPGRATRPSRRRSGSTWTRLRLAEVDHGA